MDNSEQKTDENAPFYREVTVYIYNYQYKFKLICEIIIEWGNGIIFLFIIIFNQLKLEFGLLL